MNQIIEPKIKLKTAVLFLVFNRLDTTKQVFEAIKQAKPPRLYIAADGARIDKNGEAEIVESVREYILNSIDWECDVKSLFRDQNLGCKYAVSSAISWFFENEEQGIILEDDVVPNLDFFYFIEDCLEKYKNDQRIMMITGTNYLGDSDLNKPYFFSEHITIWGWGTWKRAWSLYDVDMKLWRTEEAIEYFKNKYLSTYIWWHFKNTFESLESNYVDTWDIQWVFTCLYNHGLCITPRVNLISNVGVEGTHANGVTDSHFIEKENLDIRDYAEYFPEVHVYYEYDFLLHSKKTKKAARRSLIIDILKKLYIYEWLKKIKKVFKKNFGN